MKKSKFTSTTRNVSQTRRALLTVEVVQEGGKFKAVLVELQPLALATPPEGEDRLDALAREIVRRARYQLLPFSEREKWKDERHGIAARALEFDGMTQTDLMRASPEEMIGRFLDMTRKRKGNTEADLLKEKTDQLLRERQQSSGA